MSQYGQQQYSNGRTGGGTGLSKQATEEEQRIKLTEVSREIEKKGYQLPTHIDPKRFKAAALAAIAKTPSLLDCNRHSLFLALARAAQDGLMPDGRRAALVPYKGEVQYLPMVWGLAELARNSGDVGAVFADIVCERDLFDYSRGSEEYIRHRPPLDGDRGMMIGAFAIVRRKDGVIFDFDYMPLPDIERRRKSGSAQKGPWGTPPRREAVTNDDGSVSPPLPIGGGWYDEMAKKTVLKHVFKRCHLAPDLDDVLARDNEAEFVVTDGPTRAPTAAPGRFDKLGALTAGHAPEVVVEESAPAREPEPVRPPQQQPDPTPKRTATPAPTRSPEDELRAQATQAGETAWQDGAPREAVRAILEGPGVLTEKAINAWLKTWFGE